MRHMNRTHKVDLAFLHERFAAGDLFMEKTESKHQSADIFTKAFALQDWPHACALILTATLNDSYQAVSGAQAPAGLYPTHTVKDKTATRAEQRADKVRDDMLMLSSASASSSSVAGDRQPGCSSPKLDRTLIEVCTEDDSSLGSGSASADGGCLVIRITKSTDLTTPAGLGVGLEGVRKDGRTLAWVAIPCTGGSVLQAANAHLPGASRRMAAHLKLFRALWKNAVVIMDAVLASGGI